MAVLLLIFATMALIYFYIENFVTPALQENAISRLVVLSIKIEQDKYWVGRNNVFYLNALQNMIHEKYNLVKDYTLIDSIKYRLKNDKIGKLIQEKFPILSNIASMNSGYVSRWDMSDAIKILSLYEEYDKIEKTIYECNSSGGMIFIFPALLFVKLAKKLNYYFSYNFKIADVATTKKES